MINVLASIYIKEGKLDEYLKIFKPNVLKVLAEKGCIEYRPTMDIDINSPAQILNKNVITIIEKWETMEDLTNHGVAPHMLDYKVKVKDLVEKLTIKVLEEI